MIFLGSFPPSVSVNSASTLSRHINLRLKPIKWSVVADECIDAVLTVSVNGTFTQSEIPYGGIFKDDMLRLTSKDDSGLRLPPSRVHSSLGSGIPLAMQRNSTGSPTLTCRYRGSMRTTGGSEAPAV